MDKYQLHKSTCEVLQNLNVMTFESESISQIKMQCIKQVKRKKMTSNRLHVPGFGTGTESLWWG